MITFRTAGAWGAGKGSNLTPAEVDANFYDLDGRVAELEDNPPGPNQIADITQVGDQITIVMEDASTFGPFTLPRSLSRPSITTAVSGLTLTPDPTQIGCYFRCTNDSGCEVTISDVPSAFPVDSELYFRQEGDEQISFDPGGSSTLNIPAGYNAFSAGRGAVVVAKKVGTLTWDLFGDLEPSGGASAAPFELIVAATDETTDITTGTAKATFRMPDGVTLTAVRASLTTASSSGVVTVDINEGGASILSTKLTIDASEKTSTTAATPAVISDASLADDAEITIDIDTAGTGAKGLKVVLIGNRT
ncbi:hypothetical protein RLPCCGM1_c1253 [Rhizobium leguminosarum bv. phaseoli CCGM1]|uniref:hypothetical protein n=1 Tax=Rhizobium phaseoli TaxID=396 RepID=UPI0004DA6E17|nr:hypothetical protein [Rhizobium phaseoli]KEC73137.1 hypothetical protein RLPCCGM1_c1253 [Rhizobium leguminosarum bv. phaseoli CCGM1]PWI54108.1 hypothetical protein B5K03_11745 [Rhizobium phaseoli]